MDLLLPELGSTVDFKALPDIPIYFQTEGRQHTHSVDIYEESNEASMMHEAFIPLLYLHPCHEYTHTHTHTHTHTLQKW